MSLPYRSYFVFGYRIIVFSTLLIPGFSCFPVSLPFSHSFLLQPLHLFLIHSSSDRISTSLSERLPYTSWTFSVPVSSLNLRLIRLTLLLSHPSELGGRAATISQPAACATDSITALHVPRLAEGWAARYRSALILRPELRVYPPLMTCCWGPPGVDANTSRKKKIP